MSKAQLKKALKGMEKDDIINTVIELYDARKDAKEYLEYWLNPDPRKELEKCEKLIDRQFFTAAGVSRRTPSLTTIAKIQKDFMSICFEPEIIAGLLLFIAEREYKWLTERYRKAAYRSSLKKNINEAELYIKDHDLEPIFGVRLEKLKEVGESLLAYQADLSTRPIYRQRRYW